MIVTVYLNDDPNALIYGYNHRTAQLHHKFEFELPNLDSWHKDTVHEALDRIYYQLNTTNPEALWAIAYREKGFSPLSVGDVVVLDGAAYSVELAGWKPATLQPTTTVDD